ncbi:cytochrome P450 [Kovacikia minuta CCNUW1]|uniref:cytochrome P450 n=1 Tax=Kovacikia minuta TaxID=2931930 RepID=UPI001CD00ED9|nr:cytochrome P450 [Kovacikia minuta]UBF27130.1 cytochrome P450 [Kovacikia minuta CCNUW1]
MNPLFPIDPETDPALPGHPDPYPIYHQLRALKPVFWSSAVNGWVLLRYADAIAYLSDRRFSRQAYLQTLQQRYGDSPILESQRREIVFTDPPQHKRLRRLADLANSLQDSTPFRPQIERLVNQKIDQVQARGEMDLIADLAEPLPPQVLARWLGVPLAIVPSLKAWRTGDSKGTGNRANS